METKYGTRTEELHKNRGAAQGQRSCTRTEELHKDRGAAQEQRSCTRMEKRRGTGHHRAWTTSLGSDYGKRIGLRHWDRMTSLCADDVTGSGMRGLGEDDVTGIGRRHWERMTGLGLDYKMEEKYGTRTEEQHKNGKAVQT